MKKIICCTSLAVWLAFPCKRWPINKNNAMFHPVDARQIPETSKIPFLAYGGLITIVLALIIGGALEFLCVALSLHRNAHGHPTPPHPHLFTHHASLHERRIACPMRLPHPPTTRHAQPAH